MKLHNWPYMFLFLPHFQTFFELLPQYDYIALVQLQKQLAWWMSDHPWISKHPHCKTYIIINIRNKSSTVHQSSYHYSLKYVRKRQKGYVGVIFSKTIDFVRHKCRQKCKKVAMTQLSTLGRASCSTSIWESETIFFINMEVFMMYKFLWFFDGLRKLKNFKFVIFQFLLTFRRYLIKRNDIFKLPVPFQFKESFYRACRNKTRSNLWML